MHLSLFSSLLVGVAGHGYLRQPMSRQEFHDVDAEHWFSQPASIPGKPTINDPNLLTVNVELKDKRDWTVDHPWRAPGSAEVLGSGCGVNGGSTAALANGGLPHPSHPVGYDGALLEPVPPTVWKRGDVAEVAWRIVANHGGGYSYRLCKADRNVTEECFQETVLRFHGDASWLRYIDGTHGRDMNFVYELPKHLEIPRVTTTVGTHPEGSEWARNPVPACRYCDPSDCGTTPPNLAEAFVPVDNRYGFNRTLYGGAKWYKEKNCYGNCVGFNMNKCPPGMTQFEEPLPGISGYHNMGTWIVMSPDAAPEDAPRTHGFDYDIVDQVVIPKDLELGDYTLSFRWDCEQSTQIWMQCSDVRIVDADVEVL